MKKFLINMFGNPGADGEWSPSLKKFSFLLANLVAFVMPTIFVYQEIITGADWIRLMIVVIPSVWAGYNVGKWIDGKNGNGK